MIIGLPISLFSLMGYIFSVHHWLKVPFRLSPLFCCCSLVILLFWAALAQLLLPVTLFLIVCGSLLSLTILVPLLRSRKKTGENPHRDSLIIFTGLVVVSLLCSFAGRLSVIDDYAYWAIISKSIAMFDGLPASDTTIFARHLTYTPGLALFQYYFFSAGSGYSLPVAYFAQNIFLFSLLFALTDGQNRLVSLVMLSAAVILLVLFAGSVFQKLRVDHFLSVTACAVLWTQMRNRFSLQRFAVICSAISCLYLIKEVGFFLAISLLLAVLLDLIFASDIQEKERKASLFLCLGLFFYLILQKICWDSHCAALGFSQFHSGISLEAIGTAFNLTGNSESRHAFFIFLRDILIGSADRLNLPYLLWYLLLGLLWCRILKVSDNNERQQYYRQFYLLLPLFLIYLGMNYVMQVVIFGLGISRETTTSLDRYVNIYFFWFVLFTIETSLVRTFLAKKSAKSRRSVVFIIIAALLLAGSSIPHSRKKYERELDALLPELKSHIETGSRICLTPGNIEDHYLGFRLLYYLFPTRCNVESFPGYSGRKNLEEKLLACDYLLFYQPDRKTRHMFSSFTADKIVHQSLYKVSHHGSAGKPLSLKRIY